ncbi:putative metal-binding motif-containing protein [Candidatus Uhrbacteria bacterium]|nr:putative metal-binding motif-containing protein [Candidatus Uhrbacteria bacterium]
MALGLASTALAAPPNWTGFAGLVDADRDGYPAFTGTSTAASTGYTGAIDCNDTHANMNPGQTEVVGDGIDQDCSGSDSVFPVSDPTVARYRANYGSWNANTFITEYARCKAAGECELDDVAGTMKIKPANADTHVFRDIYVGTVKVLGADGIREVVTLEEASHFRGGNTSGGTSGVGKSYVDASSGVLREEARKAEEARLAADAKHDAALAAIQADNDLRDGVINDHGRSIAGLEGALALQADALDAEAKTRREADTALSGRIGSAESNASTALTTANSAAAHGPLLEAYAQGGFVAGTPVTDDGDVARNGFGGGGGAGINFGLDGDGYRVNGFVDTIIGGDGGAGPAHSESIGAEVTFDAGSGWHLGPFAAYSIRHTQPNALESQVVGKNPLVGLSVAAPFAPNGAAHGLFQARVGCGPEFVGMSGDSVTSGVSLGCRATIGIGGGVGALQ